MSEERQPFPVIRCQILTPSEILFDEEAECVTCPAIDGDVGIYYSHTPFISLLRVGQIRLDLPQVAESLYFDVEDSRHCFLEVCVDRVRIFLNK